MDTQRLWNCENQLPSNPIWRTTPKF